ncbi:uncharacterized protein YbjQ (UPF0145 family) [Rhodothalassium salexigens DSM 2132]|uniref:UPF0145 protein EV659_102119 n=1 Tax=Rhodothalassium salexigens DSM 2132 TaxID=1188247 RepID=A0A4R2PPM5_RHOSA|nr:YbjQ family protein [Rhodothalassium salexigens]MBB4210731.1 uncharacterized protein YbjQ (UPF0145 family) [Rhodothalassium salexigens DSM 2132]MBK1638288.1 hypothetical protein [Rhodothalassium salexigens DSM 2132]TCP37713.1 uncharacterized protein YbjQ (UPF0145 family) [Rhodothalassium salexigens DSM 2132]
MAVLRDNQPAGRLIVTNTETVPGHRVVEQLGVVQGSTVRAKHLGRDILAGLKNLVGGELKSYTALMTEAREEAIARLVAEADGLGADAVVNLRLSTMTVTDGAAEILAYGTAVRLVRVATEEQAPDRQIRERPAPERHAPHGQPAPAADPNRDAALGATVPGPGAADPLSDAADPGARSASDHRHD